MLNADAEKQAQPIADGEILPLLGTEKPENLPALALAYLGDAVYELEVRKHILACGIRRVEQLHQAAIRLVCAGKQAEAAHFIEPDLSETEIAVLKRGRNAKSHDAPKGASPGIYHLATGLEALIGYWYLTGQTSRLDWFFERLWTLAEESK